MIQILYGILAGLFVELIKLVLISKFEGFSMGILLNIFTIDAVTRILAYAFLFIAGGHFINTLTRFTKRRFKKKSITHLEKLVAVNPSFKIIKEYDHSLKRDIVCALFSCKFNLTRLVYLQILAFTFKDKKGEILFRCKRNTDFVLGEDNMNKDFFSNTLLKFIGGIEIKKSELKTLNFDSSDLCLVEILYGNQNTGKESILKTFVKLEVGEI